MANRRCLIICPIYEPYAGGGGQYFPLLSDRLLKKGFVTQCDIVTEYHPNMPLIQSNSSSTTIYRVLPRRDSIERKSHIYNILSFLITQLLILSFSICYVVLRRPKYLHFTRYYRRWLTAPISLVTKVFRCRFVGDLRATSSADFETRSWSDFHLVIANSISVYNEAKKNVSSEKLFYIKNPLQLPDAKKILLSDFPIESGVSPLDKYILFCGQILERKSILELIRAFELFISDSKFSDFKLIIVGRNMMGEAFENMLRSQSIHYLGPRDRQYCLRLMASAEIVALPSKIEGIPRVALEALSLNRKVLLPSCVPEFLVDTDFVCFDLSPEKMAKQLKEIAISQERPSYPVCEHDANKVFEQIAQVYNDANIDE